MPQTDSAAILVARFLRTNGYNETLEAFLKEAGLPPGAGVSSAGSLTIETVLDEKKIFDLTRNFEKVGVEDQEKKWLVPAPTSHSGIQEALMTSNVLSARFADLVLQDSNDETSVQPGQVILATTADKHIHILAAAGPHDPLHLACGPFDAPVLTCLVLEQRYIICTTMSGRTVLFDAVTKTKLDERQDHRKYVVRAAVHRDEAGLWLATAGWDAKVFCYHIRLGDLEAGTPKLGQAIAVLDLPSNPEAMIFIVHPEISTPVVLISRRDSTFLYYYGITYQQKADDAQLIEKASFTLLGKQNLAPHSNAWVAFSPSAIAVCPTDSSLLAVATSSMPHMKLILVRMLLPPPASASDPSLMAGNDHETKAMEIPTSSEGASRGAQAAHARAATALQDREAAAILVHATTLAPQSAYSTPDLAWRPDGSGVWVNGDDGIMRGIEAATGKVIQRLSGGHEAGAKIRCVWSGMMRKQGTEIEAVLSGGFDKRLTLWTAHK